MRNYHLPCDIDRCSTALFSLTNQLKNLALAELVGALLESLGDLGNLTCVDTWEESTSVDKVALVKWDSFLNVFLVN